MSENWNEKGIIDVLIIGAGPTGLTAAVECLRLGLKVRLIERKQQRQSNQSRALVVHSRTLEQLPMSIAKRLSEDCLPMTIMNYKVGRNKTPFEIHTEGYWMDNLDWPYVAGLAQYDTERIIEEEMKKRGGIAEWGKSVVSAVQKGGYVFTNVEDESNGGKETIKSKWLIGCDGGRSITRKEAGIGFERNTGELFAMADFKVQKPLPFKGFYLSLHYDGIAGLFPLPSENHTYRAFLQPPEGFKENNLDPAFLQNIVTKRTGMEISPLTSSDISWLTAFRAVYALSESHRHKNIFLAGDAVHLHSPIGGQGMNYGIQDAINLIWKLAWAKRYLLKAAMNNTNDESTNDNVNNIIFDSYEAERRPLAKALVKNTNRGMYFASIKNPIFKFLRNMIFRIMIYFNIMPKLITNSISMLDLAYTDPSPILFTSAKSQKYYLCKNGERMPNLKTTKGEPLYHCIDRTRHSFVMVHSSLSTVDDYEIFMEDEGPGGLSLLHIVVPSKKKLKSHAILVRPDLYVAVVGDTLSDIWEMVGKKIGVDARDCM